MRHEESDIQIACVRWFRYQHQELKDLLFSIPNGGARNAVTASILKAEGVVAGVSDLILLVPRHDHPCLCIEMKTPKGRQSPAQKEWQQQVESIGGKYIICRSVTDFMDEVENYLK